MQVMEIGGWSIRFIEESRGISLEILEELEEFINTAWFEAVLSSFRCSKENWWWAMKQFGVPSPIIRVDMAPPVDIRPVTSSIYEIEIRPAGLGVLFSLLSSEQIKSCRQVLEAFNCQGFVQLSDSPIQDDVLAAKILYFPYHQYQRIGIPEGLGPYWIRCEKPRPDLSLISLVPTQGDEDKKYLVDLGLAEMYEQEKINWDSPFVIKPLVGSKMRGVEIYLPPNISKSLGNPRGTSTMTRVMRVVSGDEPYIVQSFIPPAQEEVEGQKGWAIWRLFFGWKEKGYSFLGGFWNWRPNLRIHGASDAVFCLLTI